MADFSKAQFARHPDGRIAARIDLDDPEFTWITQDHRGGCQWYSDAEMAASEWEVITPASNGPTYWDQITGHPAFVNCYATSRPLNIAMMDRLDELLSLERSGQGCLCFGVAGVRVPPSSRSCPVHDPSCSTTPRELLDAAWKAAYVPEDEVIPAGTPYLTRHTNGRITAVLDGFAFNAAARTGDGFERRLLDPPKPKRPEGAEELEAVVSKWGGRADEPGFADWLAERGVRVVES